MGAFVAGAVSVPLSKEFKGQSYDRRARLQNRHFQAVEALKGAENYQKLCVAVAAVASPKVVTRAVTRTRIKRVVSQIRTVNSMFNGVTTRRDNDSLAYIAARLKMPISLVMAWQGLINAVKAYRVNNAAMWLVTRQHRAVCTQHAINNTALTALEVGLCEYNLNYEEVWRERIHIAQITAAQRAELLRKGKATEESLMRAMFKVIENAGRVARIVYKNQPPII